MTNRWLPAQPIMTARLISLCAAGEVDQIVDAFWQGFIRKSKQRLQTLVREAQLGARSQEEHPALALGNLRLQVDIYSQHFGGGRGCVGGHSCPLPPQRRQQRQQYILTTLRRAHSCTRKSHLAVTVAVIRCHVILSVLLAHSVLNNLADAPRTPCQHCPCADVHRAEDHFWER